MGDILSIKGEIKEAQHCYLKAIAIQSDFVDAYINLGSL
ncbi:MAG: tetratricopeptide repeat protein, partial [Planktothrix agardhii KL2]|nr:tetratricopeptide repeat protein [Planktothrix agardhii KL2]